MPTEPSADPIREETKLAVAFAVLLSTASLIYCARHQMLLLYGDAVAHLHIARRVFDSLNPGYRQLGSVWLPLPHLLILPFVQRTDWWQSGLAGAIPSMASYALACAGIYRLARRWLEPLLAALVLVALALNPGLLYMSVTAMTEPLFLALMIWSVVHLTAFEAGSRSLQHVSARTALWKLLLVLIAAVFTRYDGWILGALAWILVAVWALRRGWLREPANRRAFYFFTALLLAAPLAWMGYNWKYYGDPLDFLRGPYSARAIEARTTKPGSSHYPGWHNVWVALLYYIKSAKMGAAPLRCGRWLVLLAVAGTAYAVQRFRSSVVPAALLFWMPAAFYAYSVAYASVPIFLPVWFPHSYYNTRYGMEMLPAFALFPAFAALAVADRRPQWKRAVAAGATTLIVASNALLLHATPLVLQEARVNSSTRIPFEQAIARNLMLLPPQATLLMYTSAHVGALQQIGFPLRQTVNEGDYTLWRNALQSPAQAADFVVAIDGDPVAEAVRDHPQHLQLLFLICSTGQPCARIYRSTQRAVHY
jgi:hypothetical protein